MNCLSRLTRLLIPAPCLLCRVPTLLPDGLCPQCDAIWGDPRPAHRCTVCAIGMSEPGGICADCLRQPRPFERTLAGVDYDASARVLIHRLKFQRDTSVMAALIRPMMAAIERYRTDLSDTVDWPDGLVPMPIHARRRRERGFNQARLIADELGRRLGVPVYGHVAQRVTMSDPQSKLDAAERRKRLRGAFVADGALPAHVAIVDDVMTTGSTADSLARVLKKAGVTRVTVWVLARTPRPGG